MTLKEQAYYELEVNKNKEELIETIVSLRLQLDEKNAYISGNSDVLTAMHKEYENCKKECDDLKTEVKDLKAALTAAVEKEQLREKDIFGRGTEKLSELISTDASAEVTDEAESEPEDITCSSKERIF